MKIFENILISDLTTMRLGGKAEFVIEIENAEEIPEAFDFANDKNLPIFFLGDGANTLGRDEGFPGVILINKIHGIKVLDEEENLISAMGGEKWDDVVEFTTSRNWSGIEAMSGIPGTLAAAPVQNIGAYGQEFSQVVESVDVFDSILMEYKTLDKTQLNFDYRHSVFNFGEDKNRYFVISATLKLNDKQMQPPFYNSLQNFLDENGIEDYSPKNIRAAVLKIRGDKLPDPRKTASAGSFFKNIVVSKDEISALKEKGIPVRETETGGKINSAWLIENAGLKGAEFFGFRISEKAPLVLINENGRSFENLMNAKAEICRIVFDKFGINLEQEPVELK